MLRREMELEVKLVRIEPYRIVEYTSEQRGLPAARHWRHLEGTSAAAGSTALSNPEEKRHFSRLLLLSTRRRASAGVCGALASDCHEEGPRW